MNSRIQSLIDQARDNANNEKYKTALDLLLKAEKLARNNNKELAFIHFEMTKLYSKVNDIESVELLIYKILEEDQEISKDIYSWLKKLKNKSLKRKITNQLETKNSGDESLGQFNFNKQKLYVAASFLILFVLLFGSNYFLSRNNNIKISKGSVSYPNLNTIEENIGLVVYSISLYYFDSVTGVIEVDIPISTGSSFAVSSDGLLLTNKHVIQSPKTDIEEFKEVGFEILNEKLIVCFDKSETEWYEAKVVHEFPYADIALIKIDKHFSSPLNNISNNSFAGEPVYACGYPGNVIDMIDYLDKETRAKTFLDRFRELRAKGKTNFLETFSENSFQPSLTKGIVSSIRKINEMEWIQTDAPIKHGNSGGTSTPYFAKSLLFRILESALIDVSLHLHG